MCKLVTLVLYYPMNIPSLVTVHLCYSILDTTTDNYAHQVMV